VGPLLRSWLETGLIGITRATPPTRENTLPIIDLGNISRLGAAWSKHTLIQGRQSGRASVLGFPPQRMNRHLGTVRRCAPRKQAVGMATGGSRGVERTPALGRDHGTCQAVFDPVDCASMITAVHHPSGCSRGRRPRLHSHSGGCLNREPRNCCERHHGRTPGRQASPPDCITMVAQSSSLRGT